jgi:hypothetical protein
MLWSGHCQPEKECEAEVCEEQIPPSYSGVEVLLQALRLKMSKPVATLSGAEALRLRRITVAKTY